MRWSRISKGRRRRRPGMKRVPGQSGFSFRCHRVINERERERERERETCRKEPIQFNINMIETKLVYMHEKCINV